MRYGILSDVHANVEALNVVLDAYQKERIDRLLCIGDIVGYGANPKECIQIIRDRAITSVAGNHDWAVSGQFGIDFFNPAAKEAVLWTQKTLDDGEVAYLNSLALTYHEDDFCLVHGTPLHPQDFYYMFSIEEARISFRHMGASVCFIGHTHVSLTFIKANEMITYGETGTIAIEPHTTYIVNVGSVGQPRDRDPRACFGIYDTDTKIVEIKRIPYDVVCTQQKILQAGIPSFFAQRLTSGE
mgnify:CR=1 FL=1